MRFALLALLAFAGTAPAQEDAFPSKLKVFQDAAKQVVEPGTRARVLAAIDAVVATKDVRASAPLVRFFVRTYDLEQQVNKETRRVEKVGADAADRLEALEAELQLLRRKERAGDRNAGPEIQRREEEERRQASVFKRVTQETQRLGRVVSLLKELREKVIVGSIEVLAAQDEGPRLEAALTAVRQLLDVANHTQALYLVRVLRGCGKPATEKHLVQVVNHPKADRGILRAAVSALARLRTRTAAAAMLKVWERDPEGLGTYVRHELSTWAGRRLEDLAAARAWAGQLK